MSPVVVAIRVNKRVFNKRVGQQRYVPETVMDLGGSRGLGDSVLGSSPGSAPTQLCGPGPVILLSDLGCPGAGRQAGRTDRRSLRALPAEMAMLLDSQSC